MKELDTSKQSFLIIARILVGLLFIFSGLIKANDPIGFGYKLQEYFEVFHITFLHDYSVAIAIILCTLEIVMGTLLLLGFWSGKAAWVIRAGSPGRILNKTNTTITIPARTAQP